MEELYYEFSPLLMTKDPRATVKAWMEAKRLAPARLIPALVRYCQLRERMERDAKASTNEYVLAKVSERPVCCGCRRGAGH